MLGADGSGGETPSLVTTPPRSNQDRSPPSPAPTSGAAVVEVTCRFGDGWVTVLPASAYDPAEQFLMQALIGFTTDPQFWGGLPEYARYAPYAARSCAQGAPTRIEVPAGAYYLLVGWAGRFDGSDYHDNGYLEQITLQSGQSTSRTLEPSQMRHTWLCISCPYLVVSRDGLDVELGQVLVDRYSAARAGTDVRTAILDVRDGRVEVVVAEREPEVTHLDALEVLVDGRRLRPIDLPAAARRADSRAHTLTMGQQLRATFDARHLANGRHRAEIRVTGHYVPVGPTL